MALNRKIAYIDLTTGEVEIKPIPLELRNKFIGGRGLDAYLLYNHTKQGVDPLGPDNVLLISGGLLTATCASATTRTHVMAKSALTGMLGSTNMGGFFAPELAWAGFHHLVIRGKADKPVYLFIHNGEIEIRSAKNIWGKSVTETQWAIREELRRSRGQEPGDRPRRGEPGAVGERHDRHKELRRQERNGLHHGFQESQSGCRSRDYGRFHHPSRGSS